jgi:hypothetical protein
MDSLDDKIISVISDEDDGIRIFPFQDFYYHTLIFNTILKNMSTNEFAERFVEQEMKTGSQFFVIDSEKLAEYGITKKVSKKTGKDLTKARKETKIILAQKIILSEELDELAFMKIDDKKKSHQPTTEAEENSYEKKLLRLTYKYEGEINEDWLSAYNSDSCKKIWRARSFIFKAETRNIWKSTGNGMVRVHHDLASEWKSDWDFILQGLHEQERFHRDRAQTSLCLLEDK